MTFHPIQKNILHQYANFQVKLLNCLSHATIKVLYCWYEMRILALCVCLCVCACVCVCVYVCVCLYASTVKAVCNDVLDILEGTDQQSAIFY